MRVMHATLCALPLASASSGSLRDGRVRAALAITTYGCAAVPLPLRLNRLLQAWASLRNHSCSGFWTRKGSDLFLGAMSGPLALRQLSHVPAMALGRVLVRAPFVRACAAGVTHASGLCAVPGVRGRRPNSHRWRTGHRGADVACVQAGARGAVGRASARFYVGMY